MTKQILKNPQKIWNSPRKQKLGQNKKVGKKKVSKKIYNRCKHEIKKGLYLLHRKNF